MEDNTWKLTTVSLPYVNGLAERIQKICSPEVSLPGQATNRIQHDQELCLLHPLQLW